jgi:hypothetical protein
MPTENLSELLGRVSENSTSQIDDLVGDFGRLREKLRTDGNRIQREIEEYSRLSQQVMQLTKTISESVEKVRASVDRPHSGKRMKRLPLGNNAQPRWSIASATLKGTFNG